MRNQVPSDTYRYGGSTFTHHISPSTGMREKLNTVPSHPFFDAPAKRSPRKQYDNDKQSVVNGGRTPTPEIPQPILSNVPEYRAPILENGCVRVVIRCRPMNSMEREQASQSVFRFPNETTKEHKEVHVISKAGNQNQELIRTYKFDLCAPESMQQEQFFQSSGVMSILEAVKIGYRATVFSYGQTGSGKTYSMSGLDEIMGLKKSQTSRTLDENDGIIPRSIKFLYSEFQQTPVNETKFVVRASYCEIYNEQVFDLLNPASGALNVRWTAQNGFYVQDLLVVSCDTIEDALAVIHEGHKNRKVACRTMNKDSSRSHSILTIYVDRRSSGFESTSENPVADGLPIQESSNSIVRYGKVSFVDLAGSERLRDTSSVVLDETTNINKSLLTLGKVISALEAKTGSNFIPYRDSQLTKLLMDSLGGDSLTLMIACVSPAASSLEETLSTLNYAGRAKNIRNIPTIQVDPIKHALCMLQVENQALKHEVAALKEKLRIGGTTSPCPYCKSTDTSRSMPSHSSRVSILNDSRMEDDTYNNDLYILKQQNDKLRQNNLLVINKSNKLKEGNERLQLSIKRLESNTKSTSPKRLEPDASNTTDHTIQTLKKQIQALQQREYDLMNALSRRSRGNPDR